MARMVPAPHHRLLLEGALAIDPERAAAARRRWAAEVDLDKLDFGSLQLLPLLGATAGELGDERLEEQVHHVVRFTWLRTQLLARSVVPAVTALRDAGLDPMLSKGAALVAAHGVEQRLRPMFDIDVVVDASRLLDAARVLGGLGFDSELGASIDLDAGRLARDSHAAPFGDARGAMIDLHWHVLHTARNDRLDDLFRARSVDCELMGAPCRATGLEDSIVIAIGHGTRWARAAAVRWVGDVALLLRGSAERIDWDLVELGARQARLSLQVADGLAYVGELTGVTIPPDAVRALRRAPVPAAVRLRGLRRPYADGGPRPAGRLGALAEAYEEDAGGSADPGARTGPVHVAGFLARRWGLTRATSVPAHGAWVALGRPWRLRAAARRGLGRDALSWLAGRGHYELGTELDLRAPSEDVRWLGPGWWYAEPHGTWTRAHAARIVLPLRHPVPNELRLDAYVHAPIAPLNREVVARVVVGDTPVAAWRMDESAPGGLRQAPVPAKALTPEAVAVVTLIVDPTMTPADARLNSDLRQIGIALSSLRLAAEPVPALAPPASPAGT